MKAVRRAVKRWSGASAAFLKRHNPMSAAAGLRMPKLSSNNRFGTPKWPQVWHSWLAGYEILSHAWTCHSIMPLHSSQTSIQQGLA